jgi:hypothetical protein
MFVQKHGLCCRVHLGYILRCARDVACSVAAHLTAIGSRTAVLASDDLQKLYAASIADASAWAVIHIGGSRGEVKPLASSSKICPIGGFKVDLTNKTNWTAMCSCGSPRKHHIPCCHVIAYCLKQKVSESMHWLTAGTATGRITAHTGCRYQCR